MSLPLRVKQVAGSQKNLTLQIRGLVSKDYRDLSSFPVEEKFDRGLPKLSSALWVIQEKLCLYLWWNPEDLLLPMESRNSVRFDHALQPPEGWNGTMYLSASNWNKPDPMGKAFLLVLDFDR